MKRRAVFGQWKTPPQVLFPSSSSGMKKSASTPVFPSGLFPRGVMSPFKQEKDDALDGEFGEDLGKFDFGGAAGFDGMAEGNSFMDTGLEDDYMQSESIAASGRGYGYHGDAMGLNSQLKSSISSQSVGDFRSLTPKEYVKDASVGGKRTVQGLARIRKLEGVDQVDDGEDKKAKRLARNRAAARMRRQRRKTIVDTLERELLELERSIALLKDVNSHLDTEAALAGGVLSIPEAVIKSSLERAEKAKAGDTDKCEDAAAQAMVDVNTPKRTDLLSFLVGNESDKYSLSLARRRAAIQFFIDCQISSCRGLAISSAGNTVVTAVSKPSKSTSRAILENCVNNLHYARRLAVTHHLPGSPAAPKEEPANGEEKSRPREDKMQTASTRRVLFGVNEYASPVSGENSRAGFETVRMDLLQTLQLKPTQTAQLKKLSHALLKERIRLHALERVSLSFACHDWMEFPFLEQAQSQFRGLLSEKQITLFNYFVNKNERQINQLNLELKSRKKMK